MSKNTDEMIDVVRKLESFGLNEKEARVYLALLPYRDIGSSKIIRATGLHGQFVYDALDKLEQLGLAKHVIQNGRKKFSASTPTRILSLIDEKRIAAQSVIRDLQQRFVGGNEQDFEIYQGEGAFAAHEFETMQQAPEGSELDIIGAPNMPYMSILGPNADEYERIRLEKKFMLRYIGSPSQAHELSERKKKTPLFEYRLLPGHAVGRVNTDIWWDQIHLNIFGDPLLSFTLKSKTVADGYREFFETLWNLSSK
jgi:predicted DNA-binding transcriptional regulator